MGADRLPPPSPGADPAAALLARRIVLAHGDLDGEVASRLSATLMLLDASGDDRIVLRLSAVGASIDTALTLMDVIGVLGVPVDTVASGTLSGGGIGVFATGRRREITAHGRLHLCETETSVAGRASEIERAVAAEATRRDDYRAALARCTGRPVGEIGAEWERRRLLEAGDAVALGYADAVLR